MVLRVVRECATKAAAGCTIKLFAVGLFMSRHLSGVGVRHLFAQSLAEATPAGLHETIIHQSADASVSCLQMSGGLQRLAQFHASRAKNAHLQFYLAHMRIFFGCIQISAAKIALVALAYLHSF
jgi:hypothetical protein